MKRKRVKKSRALGGRKEQPGTRKWGACNPLKWLRVVPWPAPDFRSSLVRFGEAQQPRRVPPIVRGF